MIFWAASLPDKKSSTACQKLILRFMPIKSIANKRNLTPFTILGSLTARHETLQSMSKADFWVHAHHKYSPQKEINPVHYFG